MQSFNIASIILSAQTMDSLVISIIGKTCGIGIHPDAGFFCVNRQKAEGSPFEERYMLLTAGYLVKKINSFVNFLKKKENQKSYFLYIYL